jgi:Fic family protein
MKSEKIKKRKEVYSTEFCNGLHVDELTAIINMAKKDYEAEFVEVYENTDRCGDHEGYSLDFYKYILETDEECEERLAYEKHQEQKKKMAEEAAAKKKAEDEQMKLLELMEKYPELVKK